MTPPPPLSLADYQALARFRRGLREFLHFSEEAARAAGVAPSQHQLLLAIKAMPPTELVQAPTIGEVAEWLLLRHNSAVELVDRAAASGLVTRAADPDDARCQRLRLTAKGEEKLARLSELHREELRRLREETFAHLLSLG
jgi:DNA-binding MarR family transcriptional regulator